MDELTTMHEIDMIPIISYNCRLLERLLELKSAQETRLFNISNSVYVPRREKETVWGKNFHRIEMRLPLRSDEDGRNGSIVLLSDDSDLPLIAMYEVSPTTVETRKHSTNIRLIAYFTVTRSLKWRISYVFGGSLSSKRRWIGWQARGYFVDIVYLIHCNSEELEMVSWLY